MASVTPVVDGFVLRKGVVRAIDSQSLSHRSKTGLVSSTLPQLVQANAKHLLMSNTPTRRGIDLYPHQLVASKTVTRSHTQKLPIDY